MPVLTGQFGWQKRSRGVDGACYRGQRGEDSSSASLSSFYMGRGPLLGGQKESGMLFKDRRDGGLHLAEALAAYAHRELVVLAIPRGGVPVGFEVARELGAVLDVIVPRRIPLPGNPEVGFGAITEDGTVVLNEQLVRELSLSPGQIRNLSLGVLKEVNRQTAMYRGQTPSPKVKGKTVILVDDGLASGYTMVAAARFIRKGQPEELIAAAPVAARVSQAAVVPEVDRIVSLNVPAKSSSFAVVDYYRDFSNLADQDIIGFLEAARTGDTLRADS